MRDYLPSREEISSTEKLLDLIRSEGFSSNKPVDQVVPPNVKKKSRRLSFRGFFSLRKQVTIGVDIGHTHLRLFKVARTSEHRCRLIDYRAFPYQAPDFERSPNFPAFLKASLAGFGASARKVRLWTMMSSAQADVRHIRIPKVTKKHIFNAVYWTMKRELQFDEKETLFDFEVQGDAVEKGITKTAVMVYTVPRQDLKKVTDLFASSGFRPAGITIAPFAIQNLFRANWFPDQAPAIATLYVGNSFSRIDIFCGGNLVMTRGIKTGVGSMTEAIQEAYNEGKNQISIEMSDGAELSVPVTIEEHKTMNGEDARKVFDCFTSPSDSADEELASFNLTRWSVMEMVRPAVERLVRQMERTFEHYVSIPGNEPVGKIYVSGVVTSCKVILDYIGRQLGIEKEVLDPLNPAITRQNDVLPPNSEIERVNMTAALGLALADNHLTPNGLFTFQDKEKKERVARINQGILAVFLVVICSLLGVFFWQGHMSGSQQAAIAGLRKELTQYGQMVDQNMLLMFAGKIKSQQQIQKQKSRMSLGVAVISELSVLTPPNVHLISVKADFGSPPAGAQPDAQPKPQTAGQQPQARTKNLVVDGIIQGDRQAMELVLARYVMQLGASQLFVDPAIRSSSFETFETEGEVLRFTLYLGIV